MSNTTTSMGKSSGQPWTIGQGVGRSIAKSSSSSRLAVGSSLGTQGVQQP